MEAVGREKFVDSMLALAQAPQAEFDRILGAIDRLKGKPITPELVTEAVESVAPHLGRTVTQFAVLSVEATSNQQLIEDVVRLVGAESEASSAVADTLRTRLAALADQGLNSEFKAFLLASEYERLYSSAAVFTDIRPVHGPEDSSPIRSHLIVHHLKLKYQQLDGNRELYVATTDRELRQLAADIAVALKRGDLLRSQLGDALGLERIVDSEIDDDL